MAKKIMIVGGTGFLGFYTAKLALKKGYEVGSISILDDDLINKDLDSWYPKEITNTLLDVFSASEEEIVAFLNYKEGGVSKQLNATDVEAEDGTKPFKYFVLYTLKKSFFS